MYLDIYTRKIKACVFQISFSHCENEKINRTKFCVDNLGHFQVIFSGRYLVSVG